MLFLSVQELRELVLEGRIESLLVAFKPDIAIALHISTVQGDDLIVRIMACNAVYLALGDVDEEE